MNKEEDSFGIMFFTLFVINLTYNTKFMNKLFLLFAVFLFSFNNMKAQCVPDFLFTSLGIPGVYPPEVQLPNVQLPLGISDGLVGSAYSQTLTLVVLEDTTMDVASLLDPSIVTAMNTAGISTMMSLDVNYVIFDVDGLPNGINYICDQGNCQYNSGIDGCILFDGIPTQSGTFPVSVNMTINVQIPAITIPIVGTIISPSMPMDLPSFSAVEYDLSINNLTSLSDEEDSGFNLFPNPVINTTTLYLRDEADVRIYNVLGEVVSSYSSVRNNLRISKSDLGLGMFYVSINTFDEKYAIKLIIK